MSTLFAWDAVTTDHRLSGSNNRIYFLMVLEAGSPSSRCWQSSFLLRGILLDGWWMSSSTLFTGSSVCVCVPTHLKDTSHIGLGPTLMVSCNLNYLFKKSCVKYNHILRSEVLGLLWSGCGGGHSVAHFTTTNLKSKSQWLSLAHMASNCGNWNPQPSFSQVWEACKPHVGPCSLVGQEACFLFFRNKCLSVLQFCFCFLFWSLRHVGSSLPTRDWTHTSCPGRPSLNPWTTREVPQGALLKPRVVPGPKPSGVFYNP